MKKIYFRVNIIHRLTKGVKLLVFVKTTNIQMIQCYNTTWLYTVNCSETDRDNLYIFMDKTIV